MKCISIIKIALFVLLFAIVVSAKAQNQMRLCVDEQCRVTIDGKTNAAPYQCNCTAPKESGNCAPVNTKGNGEKFLIAPMSIAIPAKNFVCNHKKMTSDFIETIQAHNHPEITISILQIYFVESILKNPHQKNVKARIAIQLAGVTRNHDIVLTEVNFEGQILDLLGTVSLQMTHFNLEAPQALFGMIKAKDELDVSFQLRFCLE